MKLNWQKDGEDDYAFAGGFMFLAYAGHFEVFYVGYDGEDFILADYDDGDMVNMLVGEKMFIVYEDVDDSTTGTAKTEAGKWLDTHCKALA